MHERLHFKFYLKGSKNIKKLEKKNRRSKHTVFGTSIPQCERSRQKTDSLRTKQFSRFCPWFGEGKSGITQGRRCKMRRHEKQPVGQSQPRFWGNKEREKRREEAILLFSTTYSLSLSSPAFSLGSPPSTTSHAFYCRTHKSTGGGGRRVERER